jgi:NADH-quinone oxidoreductase subunit G
MALVKINGVEVEVPDGTNMIEAAKTIGVEIPHYCYHPHLTVAGNCRMCLVDIEAGGRGPDIACNMGARDGLAIRTDTDQVIQMRKSVMEFLLVNHPLDCPICDQSGECRLQDYYMDHGGYESRLVDPKVSKAKRVDIGEHIVLDGERCVACSRCVRFGDEITGTGELRLFNRGDHTEIGMFPGERLAHQYQGNLADICPVGALTNKDFRFEKRVWYLRESDSICSGCASGCNITVCHEQDEVFRYLPRRNDQVNKSWMCDPGRMSYQRIASMDRILRSQVDGARVDLDEAITKLAAAIRATADAHGAAAVGVVMGATETNEANWALFQLARLNLAGARIFHVAGNDPDAFIVPDELLVDADANPNIRGVRLLAEHGEVGDADALTAAVDDGSLKALLVLSDDILGRMGLDTLSVDVLAYLGWRTNRTAAAARYLLPVSAHVEQDATYINRNGRVQRLRRALFPAGDSQPAYRVLDSLGTALGESMGTTMGAGTFAQMAAEIAGMTSMTYKTLGTEGQDLGSATSSAPTTDHQPSA